MKVKTWRSSGIRKQSDFSDGDCESKSKETAFLLFGGSQHQLKTQVP